MEWMDSLYFYGAIRAEKAKEKVKDGVREFFTSQDGVSNVVATIIILLIVVIMISAFWDRLSGWIGQMMNDIFANKPPAEGDMGLNGI